MLEFLREDGVSVTFVVASLVVLYPFLKAIYNVTLHPAAKFNRGPLLWRCTRLPYTIAAWRGTVSNDFVALHNKYGPIIRVAPNELSISDPEAIEAIFSNKGANAALPRTPIWNAAAPGKPLMLVNALDSDYHGKMRRKMEPSFTERSVARQEEIPQEYVDLLVAKLKEKIAESGDKEAVLNIVPWMAYVTIDIIGDLAFGESFGCLKNGKLDDWTGITFNSIKAMYLMALVRHYAWVNVLLQACVPKSVMEKSERHWKAMEDKVNKRLALPTSRPDYLTLWTEEGKKGGEPLPMSEIQANAFLVSIAGSDTTASTLTGTINYLVNNPEKRDMLVKELRTRFSDASEITFAAMKELPMLNAVVWEGLRLCDPAPVASPRVTPPGGATICGEYVPGNIILSVSAKHICFNPKRFHKPTSFLPERWLPAAQLPDSPFYHDERAHVQPFSIGPRSCIGRPLALAELRVVIAKLFYNFDISKAETASGSVDWQKQKAWLAVNKEKFEVKFAARSG